jgi:hypothetical protein
MEISVKELAGLEELTGIVNFHLWKDEMMTFASIYGLEALLKEVILNWIPYCK